MSCYDKQNIMMKQKITCYFLAAVMLQSFPFRFYGSTWGTTVVQKSKDQRFSTGYEDRQDRFFAY